MSKPIFCLFAILFALLQGACAQSNTPLNLPLDKTPLRIAAASAPVFFQIEIASSPIERSRGLMFREKLTQGRGMLFVFEEADFLNFWMKNTPEPLDLIFISQDRKIVSIQMGEPFSLSSISSGGPAQYVLEIARGEAVRLGIRPGDLVFHPILDTQSK